MRLVKWIKWILKNRSPCDTGNSFSGKFGQQGDLWVAVPCGEIIFGSVFKADRLWVNSQLVVNRLKLLERKVSNISGSPTSCLLDHCAISPPPTPALEFKIMFLTGESVRMIIVVNELFKNFQRWFCDLTVSISVSWFCKMLSLGKTE